MATIGAATGLFGAWATQRLTTGLLFNISPVDPPTLAGAALFLLTVAALASAIPGALVFRIDPAQTLRQEWAAKDHFLIVTVRFAPTVPSA